MARATMSTKGQVVIPREVRERLGWKAGTTLEVVAEGSGVRLRPVGQLPETSVDDLLGCLPWDGPPKTVEEMEAGLAEGARRAMEPR